MVTVYVVVLIGLLLVMIAVIDVPSMTIVETHLLLTVSAFSIINGCSSMGTMS